MFKKCNKCKHTKNVSEFYRRYDRTNGYKSNCKACDNTLSTIRKKKNGYKYDKKRQVMGSKHHKLSKINSQKHRNEMSDMYIRSLMTKKSKTLEPKDITDEMIKICRLNLQIKRELTSRLKEGED
tara:strand:- start:201 stop:575 length:375 start_codon:yes stop_codon:yes gene_type:complete